MRDIGGTGSSCMVSRDKGTSLTQDDELAKLRLLVQVAQDICC